MQIQRIVGLLDQCDLIYPIIQQEVFQRDHPCHRGGVGNHTENEIILYAALIILHTHMVGTDAAEPGNAIENICRMSQHILGLLRRFIGYGNQSAESGNVHKVLVVEFSHVAGIPSALKHPAGCIDDPPGNTQPPGKVIGGAARNISDGNGQTAVHHPVNHFIQGAVSAGADDHIIVLQTGVFRHCAGIHRGLGRPCSHFIACFSAKVDNIPQSAADCAFAGFQIVYKVYFFHVESLPFLIWETGRVRIQEVCRRKRLYCTAYRHTFQHSILSLYLIII